MHLITRAVINAAISIKVLKIYIETFANIYIFIIFKASEIISHSRQGK